MLNDNGHGPVQRAGDRSAKLRKRPGCTDRSLPSVCFHYDPPGQVFFPRWRVEQIANIYGTGLDVGSYTRTTAWA